jgi:hypothetical protein
LRKLRDAITATRADFVVSASAPGVEAVAIRASALRLAATQSTKVKLPAPIANASQDGMAVFAVTEGGNTRQIEACLDFLESEGVSVAFVVLLSRASTDPWDGFATDAWQKVTIGKTQVWAANFPGAERRDPLTEANKVPGPKGEDLKGRAAWFQSRRGRSES